jgi:hypothetical protein
LLDECGVPNKGSCASEFGRVRDAFESNFTDRGDIGAAVAVWVEGDLVVNLWDGFADAASVRPWRNPPATFDGVYAALGVVRDGTTRPTEAFLWAEWQLPKSGVRLRR